MELFVRQQHDYAESGLLMLQSWMNAFPGLRVGFTTREGGVSKEPFASLNCGLHVADDSADVIQNRQYVATAVGSRLSEWVYAEQVHGRTVKAITRKETNSGTCSREDAIADCDAFVTNERGIFLALMFADCVPLYFYDPYNQAMGLAHAGWKGTVLEIAQATIEAMTAQYGSDPRQMYAAIGPSIGLCCYEVDEQVANRVREVAEKLQLSIAMEQLCLPLGDGKFRVNLQQLNRQIMIKAGMLPSRIEITSWCTSCSTEQFFSHRKEKGRTGRMIAWIGMPLDDAGNENEVNERS